ncbi:nephrin [Hyperolius riggenbachi]|uniref:nephrin n=1 Tax=Hyperolius riggenbachi TaxID=752182 RepID=UPI0035A30F54
MASVTVLLTICIGLLRGVWSQQQVFRVQPDNVTVVRGDAKVLLCEVERVSGIVQWVKDGLLLGPDPRIPGFPRYSMIGDHQKGEYNLRIENSDLSDDAQYHCQAGKSEVSTGIISITALLNVLIPPEAPMFKEYDADSTVTWIYGTEYAITCSTQNAKPAAVLTITKSGAEVTVESSNSPGAEEKLENTEITAKVVPQGTDNGNLLVCSALNDALQTPLTVSFTMDVQFPPDTPVIDGYEGPSVKEEDTIKLTCTSRSGNPLATLKWLKNNELVHKNWETDTKKKWSKSTLTLKIKPEHNLAIISCEAANHVTPEPLRASITLMVVFLPARVTILGSTSGPENATLSLSCYTSSSNPEVSLRWWLGPKELENAVVTITDSDHGGKVTMSNVTTVVKREHNGMQLTCEAFNKDVLYYKFQMVQINVQYPPQTIWIEAPPTTQRFRAGTPVKMICFSSGGHPAPRLTWMKDKKTVNDDKNKQINAGKIASRQIVVETEASDNQATYRCTSANDGKTVLSASTKLHVQFPPLNVKIVNDTKSYKRGSTIALLCFSNSSNPSSTIAWKKQGVTLKGQDLGTKKGLYEGNTTTSRVTLSLSSADHGKQVECKSYNSVLKEGVNTFYKLDVLFPPEFTDDQPKIVQGVEHGTALIPVHIRANPSQVNYTWSLQGRILVREGAFRHQLHSNGSLEILSVTRADSGVYNVSCVNKEGTNTMLIQLDIHYSPTILSLVDPVEVDLGGRAEIVCAADANPAAEAKFQWTWLGEEERDLSSLEQEVSGLTARLVIPEVKRSDAGRYECMVDNGVPPPIKANSRLIVRFKPEIQKAPHLCKVAAPGDGKSTASLVCKAEGIPKVAFSWAKNGVTLDFNDPKNSRYSEEKHHEQWVHSTTLVIVNVSAVHDYAIFTCTATNDLGVDSFPIHLVSTSRPDPPTDFKILNHTESSITLGWSAGFNGGLEQRFRVRYMWTGAHSYMYVDVFPPQSTVFTIMGLKGSTTYYFSVNAINALGDSDYADKGAIIPFTTPGEEEPKIPVETTPAAPTESFSWTPYLFAAMGGGGALLVISNASLVCCLLRRYRRKAMEGDAVKKDGSAAKATLNEYGDGELINTNAKKTLLIDSGSETSSSILQDSSSEVGLHYYPTRDYHPSLSPHYESGDPRLQGWPEDGYEDWYVESDAHQYEEVPVVYPPSSRIRLPPLVTGSQRREAPWDGFQEPIRVYDESDSTVPSAYETSYGEQGHLV